MLQEDADRLMCNDNALIRMGAARRAALRQGSQKGFPGVKLYSPINFTNTRFFRPPSNSP